MSQMSPPPDAHQRLVTGRGVPPQRQQLDDAVLQVHESRTLQLSPQVQRLPHELMDLCNVPEGIVSRLGQQYGPTGSRRVVRSGLVETPEKAHLRSEVERLQQRLQAAESAASEAALAERQRVELLPTHYSPSSVPI